MADLESSRLKWERGRDHTEAFYEEFSTFRKGSQLCTVGFHMDYEVREKFWHVEGPPKPLPRSLGLSVGDALQNFRATLDHLAWQLVIANKGTPGRHTQFPIFIEPDKFADRGKRMMRGMSKAAKAELRDLQPCFTPNPYRKKWLLSLEELGNIDKHRYVNLVLAGTSGGFWDPGLPVHENRWFIHDGPIEAGTKIASVSMDHADVGFAPIVDVAFGEPGPAFGESVYSLLIAIREFTKQILDTFDYGGFGLSS